MMRLELQDLNFRLPLPFSFLGALSTSDSRVETSGSLACKDVQFGAALGDEYPGESKAHSQAGMGD